MSDCVRVRARATATATARDQAFGACWSPCLGKAVIIRDQRLRVALLVAVSMSPLAVVTYIGGISTLLVWLEWPPGPDS